LESKEKTREPIEKTTRGVHFILDGSKQLLIMSAFVMTNADKLYVLFSKKK
jgi:hypothetical protein